ncbi:MAG: hypothetical protein P4L33_10965 [Capsulimonadaceae bacterium]|nr:hypothetical protein [Capsulimonadaceae bacterium]
MTTLIQRRNALLNATAAPQRIDQPGDDIFANRAMARLFAGVRTEDANRQIVRTAAWFDFPHPHGRDLRGEPDFASINLACAIYALRDATSISAVARDAIKRFFLSTDFQSFYDSENHHLLFRSSRYLAAQEWPGETFSAWTKSGHALMHEDREWLSAFLRYRAGHGWAEFDSSCYLMPDFEALLALQEYASDEEVQSLARMTLNVLLADMAVDSCGGYHGGAMGRIYPGNATDHTATASIVLQHLYFDNVPAEIFSNDVSVQLVTTTFEPEALVVRIARERAEPYINRERKHLHNMSDVRPAQPMEESIRKISQWTPEYLLGCVQHQDAYPQTASASTAGYAFHQQHDWDLTFAASPKARLFTHHPGNFDQHNHWTGDQRCGCGRYLQAGSTLLGLHAPAVDDPLPYIHAFVPRAEFDEFVEEEGWIFVRSGDAYAGLLLVDGYQWVTEGEWANREVRSPSSLGGYGVICTANRAAQCASFGAFRDEARGGDVRFNRASLTLEYASPVEGVLTLAASGIRLVNGQAIELDYAAYDSPYLQADWGSKTVKLAFGKEQMLLDFESVQTFTGPAA